MDPGTLSHGSSRFARLRPEAAFWLFSGNARRSRHFIVERKAMSEKLGFAAGDLVVYPTHGVGKILGIETQEIAGYTLSVFVVHFDKDRMTLRVPLGKAKVSGLRKLSSHKEMDAALGKLRGRSRAKRTMWSRRAQEYQAKIASGD